tara:strand:+ start:103 stop:543 length:441 start_codon:yes stop_codon:yes gene_type:complete
MRLGILLLIGLVSVGLASRADAHCQIPCGIYGDDARFTALLEDVTTLKKAVRKIEQESAADSINHNQLVRWVKNKETHADKISHVMLEYFLAQRIKSDQPDYEARLVAIHKIIVLAMKTKQNVDAGIVDDLEMAITGFQALYQREG